MTEPKKTVPVYLLAPALVLSLGLNAAQSDLIGDAKAGIEKLARVKVEETVTIPRDEFAAMTNSAVGSKICRKLETQRGLAVGKCNLNHLEGWWVRARTPGGGALDPVEIRNGIGQRRVIETDDED